MLEMNFVGEGEGESRSRQQWLTGSCFSGRWMHLSPSYMRGESKDVIGMLNWKRELQAAKVRKEDMNKLVMNFLASEAWTRAVEEFRVESGTNNIDLATVTDRMEVKKAVQTGCIADAVEKVNNIDPEIFNKNPRALFILHIQFFIELLRDGNVEKMVEAMTFAQDKLAPMAEKNGFLEDFERAFSLLVLGKGSGSPFRHLLRTSQRFETAIDVNEAILISHKNEKEAKLSSLLKMLAWVDRELEDKVIYPKIEDFSTCKPRDPAAI